MSSTNSVLIVGAGLSGTLLAISLKRRGFDVVVYECREDLRKEQVGVHRSINLVLTSRGRFALRRLGLEDAVMKLVVPAIGRCIHHEDGTTSVQPYGKDENEANYSVSRSGLNMHLLDAAEKEGVKIVFNHRLESADVAARRWTFRGVLTNEPVTVGCHMCFGADGAASCTRRKLVQHLVDTPIQNLDAGMKQHHEWGGRLAIKVEVQRLGVSYKELMFPLKKDGSEPLDTRYLHIWPRGAHFLMGLANLDGSMTGTLYLPDDAAQAPPAGVTVDELLPVSKGVEYMKKTYADAVPLIPDLEAEWAGNPAGLLATSRVSHWVFEDRVALLGDAAHAVVPFFGQGMNASFEDVSYLDYVMDRFEITPANGAGWTQALKLYQGLRTDAGHAISDMAIENASEMAAKVGQAEFLLRKQIENDVEKAVPTLFRSRYYMITNTLIPYHWCREVGTHIDMVLSELVKTAQIVDGKAVPDMGHARELIGKHVTPYLTQRGMWREARIGGWGGVRGGGVERFASRVRAAHRAIYFAVMRPRINQLPECSLTTTFISCS